MLVFDMSVQYRQRLALGPCGEGFAQCRPGSSTLDSRWVSPFHDGDDDDDERSMAKREGASRIDDLAWMKKKVPSIPLISESTYGMSSGYCIGIVGSEQHLFRLLLGNATLDRDGYRGKHNKIKNTKDKYVTRRCQLDIG